MAWCGIIVPYEVFPADVDPTQASLPLPTLTLLIDRVDTEKSRINILSDIDVSMFYYIKIPFSSMPDWWPDIKSVELARDSQVIASLFIANGGLEMRMLPVISGGGSLPGNVLTYASFTPINSLPVYSGLSGQVTSSSSSSPATLPRPLAITTTEENALILTTDQLKSIIKLVNSNPASNRASIDYDGIFEVGTDSTSIGANDYFIYNTLSAQQVLNVSASDNLVRALIGFVSSRYDIEDSITKPGGSSTTLWRRQSDGRLMNNNEPIAHLSDIVSLSSNVTLNLTAPGVEVATMFISASGSIRFSRRGDVVFVRIRNFTGTTKGADPGEEFTPLIVKTDQVVPEMYRPEPTLSGRFVTASNISVNAGTGFINDWEAVLSYAISNISNVGILYLKMNLLSSPSNADPVYRVNLPVGAPNLTWTTNFDVMFSYPAAN